ncbi:MAG: hypothetical protein AAB884_02195 [Patescibacteria group bacterium]
MESSGVKRLVVVTTILIFLSQIGGNVFGWFTAEGKFDIFAHFLGGMWIAAVLVYFEERYSRFFLLPEKKLNRAFYTLCMVLLVGVSWEFFEFVLAYLNYESYASHLYADTISDLFLDMLGGFLGIIIGFGKKRALGARIKLLDGSRISEAKHS